MNNPEATKRIVTVENNFMGNVGFKYSHKRIISSAAYQFGNKNNAVVLKLAIVFGVTNLCLRKRLLDYNLSF